MNDWSRRRKRVILAIVLFVVLVLIGIPLFLLFYQKPSCFDGAKNGDETGVDCGGSCQLLCRAESLPLIMKGDPRVLFVSSTTYQVVALVENPNADADIYRAGYIIRVYDAASAVPLKEIAGSAHVPQGSTFAVFEGPIAVAEGAPRRATLEWKPETLVWRKTGVALPALLSKEVSLSREDVSPRLEAVVENVSLRRVSNIDLTALLSDADGNIFAASKTFVEELKPGEAASVVFTWPRPFGKQAVGIDILMRVLPDQSFIR